MGWRIWSIGIILRTRPVMKQLIKSDTKDGVAAWSKKKKKKKRYVY